MLNEKIKMVEALADIEIAATMIKGGDDSASIVDQVARRAALVSRSVR